MILEFEDTEIKKVLQVIVDYFKSNEVKINNLNVFPVPDGDTGTNMLLTLKSIRKELSKLKQFDIKNIGEAISFGGLMGARGNSGVILSQILKGFFDVLSDDSDGFNLTVIESALNSAKNLAYSSVQNPAEGTMLTMIKDLYLYMKNFNESNTEDISFSDLIDELISEAEKSLIRTTYLLPVLKEANVVDAGAQGILEILKGLKIALAELNKINGNLKMKEIQEVKKDKEEIAGEIQKDKTYKEEDEIKELKDWNINSDIKYIYCTEFVLTGARINILRLKDDIESMGDSAMVVGNENMVKIHVHSNSPHRVLARALREGILHEIEINNMVDQNKEKLKSQVISAKAALPTIGLISVSNGEGIEEIFKSVGVDIVIKGGQTMNPSTYELVRAIKKLDNEKIIIFPNNKNIILTATQAAKISKRDVIIIPTKTIPQGISAVLNFNKDLTIEENLKNMEDAYSSIKSGEITLAVRDANLLVGEIKKGDFIGLFDGKIKVVSDNVVSAALELIKDMIEKDDSIITFYLGKDSKEEDKEKIKEEVSRLYPDLDMEFHNGGQPFYSYIFSIE
ncbi:DAK2 domain-containing protein [bacterium]|nr:DAK2 domain-containing protein [bacterium]